MTEYRVHTCELREASRFLRAGDRVYLSGEVYTARDAAHRRMVELLDRGETPPFDISGACIYYAGPTSALPGMPIGSCGPTTSGRMDAYAPRLLDLGLAAMIGKGGRNEKVYSTIIRNRAVYLCATGGAGALYAGCVRSAREIAFFDLGCEAVRLLDLTDMPLFVAADCDGGILR